MEPRFADGDGKMAEFVDVKLDCVGVGTVVLLVLDAGELLDLGGIALE